MSRNNISVLLWLNTTKSKINSKGLSPLYLRVSFNGQRKTIATGFSILPISWDARKFKVKGSSPDAKQVNEYIQQAQSRLINIYNEMFKEGDINLDNLVERFFGRDICGLGRQGIFGYLVIF